MEKDNKKKKQTTKKTTNTKTSKTTKTTTKPVKVEKKVKKVEKEEVDNTQKEGFLKSVWHEMKLVTWPNKKQMITYSIAAIILIIFFTLYFLGIEAVFAWIKEVFKSIF
jgi:preprotein translocase subunit SecE